MQERCSNRSLVALEMESKIHEECGGRQDSEQAAEECTLDILVQDFSERHASACRYNWIRWSTVSCLPVIHGSRSRHESQLYRRADAAPLAESLHAYSLRIHSASR